MYLSLKPFSCQVNFAYFKETKRKTKRKKDKEDEDSDMEEDDEEDPFRWDIFRIAVYLIVFLY